jgi:hypothetical protein
MEVDMRLILLIGVTALALAACGQGPVDPSVAQNSSVTVPLPAANGTLDSGTVAAEIDQNGKAEVEEAMADKTGPCGSHDAIAGKIEADGLELDHKASPSIEVYTGFSDAKLYLVKRGSEWCSAATREATAPIK